MAIRTLAPAQDAIGDEIGVSPGGQTVYFVVRKNCVDDIESVPVSGGSKPVIVAYGVLPAVSPDGTELAFVREYQAPSRDGWINFTCPPFGGGTPTVMVLSLSTGKSKSYSSPGEEPISHLSWSPDGRTLLVSVGRLARSSWIRSAATGIRTGFPPPC